MSLDKKIIVNADDYGLSKSFDDGIEEGYLDGFLTSTSIRTNGKTYSKQSMDDLKRKCPELGLGLHFNIVEGKTNLKKSQRFFNMYTDDGFYNLSYISIIINSFKRPFIEQLELELREQIERIINDVGHIDHINSHQHCNTPPRVFDLTCKLAQEYGIKYIRVPNEKVVFSKVIGKFFTKRFFINIFKCLILKFFSYFNYLSAKKYGIRTNDSFTGVLYTGFMDSTVIEKAINSMSQGEVLEVLLHPCKISGDESETFWPSVRDYVINHERRRELELLKNQSLMDSILHQGILTQYDLLDKDEISLNSSARIISFSEKSVLNRSSKRVFLVIDETTFFHPEYVNALINDFPDIECIGGCRVVLPRGGALQSYLLSFWRQLGFRDLLFLGITTILLRLRGLLPKTMRNNFQSSVAMTFEENHIPYKTISSINKPVIDYINSFDPDVVISSNSLIFPEQLLNQENITFINRHSSLLPSYGGILPVFRAIQFQEKFCGASVHLMDIKIDEGTVLSRKWLPIERGDSLFRLYKLLFVLSFEATKEALSKIGNEKTQTLDTNHSRLIKSYFSYPNKNDWIEFKNNKGRFI